MQKVFLTLFFILLLSCNNKIKQNDNDYTHIIDQANRSVRVSKNINRIVTTYSPSTAFIFQLDSSKKLVGVGNKSDLFDIFRKIKPDIARLPSVGSKKGLNIEAIVNQKPDLVVLFPSKDGEAYAEKFNSLGIAAIIIKPESSEEIKNTFKLLGRVLKREELSEKIIEATDRNLAKLDLMKKRIVRKKRVYFAANGDFFSTYTAKMLQHDMIDLSGAENVAGALIGSNVKVSIEQILTWDPEVIILSRGAFYSTQSILKDKRFKNLTAVRNKKIYKMPSDLEPLDFPSGGYILGVLWLAMKIYPELNEFNLKESFDFFYTLFYGQSFSLLGGMID